jgi:hypothetical protein
MNEFERKHAEWEERQIERAAEGKAKCGVIEVCER